MFNLKLLKMPDPGAPSNQRIDEILQQSKRFIAIPCFGRISASPPLKHINSVRLRGAYGLLEQGKSVTEAVFGVGIPNVRYFINLFKSATGATPFQWKNGKKQKTTQN